MAAIAAGELGQMVTPTVGNRLVDGATWALDNGCFADTWTEDRWLAKLEAMAGRPGCLFAVVPDVVADAAATDELWHRWAPVVRSAGYRPAYVTQNGCTAVPGDAGAIFTGGDDEWKEGEPARQLMALARASGRWCHMGRVNSLRRLRLAAADGYHSVDGTRLAFGPDVNLPILRRFLTAARDPLPLWP